MSWTVIVPIKTGSGGKSRLGSCLTPAARVSLVEAMARRVTEALAQAHGIARVLVLSGARPHCPRAGWLRDVGNGLNPALHDAARRLGDIPLLVVHGDLPLVTGQDIEALIGAAAGGGAIAPDRYGKGTNAIALARAPGLPFLFGEDSYARFMAASAGRLAVVRRPGLALDIDVPEDLDAARAAGFDWAESRAQID
jgi:2-phospho-L-lactate guanylyltransferase